MILPAILLTLDEYSSWRVGGGGCTNDTLRSLLRSDLVAELMHNERETLTNYA